MTIWVYKLFQIKNVEVHLSFSTFGIGIITDVTKINLIILVWFITINLNE